jgi:hypothetical protein
MSIHVLRPLWAYILLLCCLSADMCATESDSTFIRVHFLHGSRPKHKYRHVEDKWFGGVLGGHAGIEVAPDTIVNFVPSSRFHVFTKPWLINSRFAIHDTVSFYQILGSPADSMKKTIITIRISAAQKQRLDSVVHAYMLKTPYDYAFFGMRCGAAASDLLSQIGVVKHRDFKATYRHAFYPRVLRRRLERQACPCHYSVRRVNGSVRRRWERN